MCSSLNGVRVGKPKRDKSAGHVVCLGVGGEKGVLVLEKTAEGSLLEGLGVSRKS